MEMKCPHCNFKAAVDDAKIPDRTCTVICPSCKASFPFTKTGMNQGVLPDDEPGSVCNLKPKPVPFFKRRVFILALILVLLLVSFPLLSSLAGKIHARHDNNRWKEQDAAERVNSPGWHYDIRTFSSSRTQQELEGMFRQDGFHVRSYKGHGITPCDKTMCWMIVKDFWVFSVKRGG
jgi:predicted Zn finger-like uncharacterized protein